MMRSTIGLMVALGVVAGCGTQEPQRGEEKAAAAGWESVVYAHRDRDTGMCSLRANGILLKRLGQPREFKLLSLWRYDPDKKVWNKVAFHVAGPVSVAPVERKVYSRATDQTIFDLTDRIGLYWTEWREDGHRASTLVFSGPVACNDLKIGDPPKGFIAAGVPYPDHGRATFVPDPEIHCRR